VIDERLSKVETRLENCNEYKERDSNHNKREEEGGPLIQYEGRNVRDPNDQYLKSNKLDVPTMTIVWILNSLCKGFDIWTNISWGTLSLKLVNIKPTWNQ